ncbi:hypothetical protein RB195_010206 [Necator americanus]|uniref:Uncharacterized protein n=1 Tax=Necator americanus TaxID=51031 RepID=A0ABR1CY04_NECAM
MRRVLKDSRNPQSNSVCAHRFRLWITYEHEYDYLNNGHSSQQKTGAIKAPRNGPCSVAAQQLSQLKTREAQRCQALF